MASIGVYRTYNFLDKDPVIDKVRTLLQDADVSVTEAHKLSNVSDTTMRNWFDGPTRKPQHATIMSVVTALGFDIKFVKASSTKFDKERELKQAADWLLEHRDDKPKKRRKKKTRTLNADKGNGFKRGATR